MCHQIYVGRRLQQTAKKNLLLRLRITVGVPISAFTENVLFLSRNDHLRMLARLCFISSYGLQPTNSCLAFLQRRAIERELVSQESAQGLDVFPAFSEQKSFSLPCHGCI